MVEILQANAAGRYHHPDDLHDTPLNPDFDGAGREFSRAEGSCRLLTIRPAPILGRTTPKPGAPTTSTSPSSVQPSPPV
jgi:protocatechuate 3,4-dioxygenase beta subunit